MFFLSSWYQRLYILIHCRKFVTAVEQLCYDQISNLCGLRLKINNCRKNVHLKMNHTIILSLVLSVYKCYFRANSVIIHLFLCHREFENHSKTFLTAYHIQKFHTNVWMCVYFCHVQLVCRCGSLTEKFQFVASAIWFYFFLLLIDTDFTLFSFPQNFTRKNNTTFFYLTHNI